MTQTMEVSENSVQVPMVPWSEFVEGFHWGAGEHIGLIGPTGAGKTNLAYYLLPEHKYVVVLATKPRDVSLTAFAASNGFKTFKEWPSYTAARVPRRVIWPKANNIHADAKQRAIFADTLNIMFKQGGWTVYIDELYYMVQVLKLQKQVVTYLLQARAMGISLVCASQRPSWIPLEVYDQSTHLFFWRDNDERNLNRLSGISWRSAHLIRTIIADLPRYHVLYVNTRTGDLAITRPPAPRKVNK